MFAVSRRMSPTSNTEHVVANMITFSELADCGLYYDPDNDVIVCFILVKNGAGREPIDLKK
jgi:hypothetical protein